ncbi:MAG: hypothetical protein M5R36_25380 [Deltaproteobacteria bacterium]|nr:hypothetical protein [Deltaproteobacteria bacterium]
MRKLMTRLFPIVAVFGLVGAIGSGTNIVLDPTCVSPNTMYDFEVTLNYESPDGEAVKGAQFWIGDTWSFGTIDLPTGGTTPGTWSYQINPDGNVVEWEFERPAGAPGGGLLDGETATFTFEATTGDPEDREVRFHIFGDVGGPGDPHYKGWVFEIPACPDDDDDTGDDDVTDDDSGDDDSFHPPDDDADDDDDFNPPDDDADDDMDDDTTADDDSAADDDDDDFQSIDDDGDDDDDDDDSSGGCGCA